jgi:SAM-dependent methyltransferase
MKARTRTLVILIGAVAVGAAFVMRHTRGGTGKKVPGGILIGDAALYDALTHRLLLRSLFRGIAVDIAALAPEGAKVLEVGCGPGRLSILLAREYGLDVIGLDLDPAMIKRAKANAKRSAIDGDAPAFLVGEVASMAFPDGSFDLVVSTLSMHHWADPIAGLTEIGRVLRPDGRTIAWDLARWVPLHRHLIDPAEHAQGSSLRVPSTTPWRWPWRLTLIKRIELVRRDTVGGRRRKPTIHRPSAPAPMGHLWSDTCSISPSSRSQASWQQPAQTLGPGAAGPATGEEAAREWVVQPRRGVADGVLESEGAARSA